MVFNSLQFILTFPLILCLYYLVPARWKTSALAVISIYFYACFGIQYLLLLIPVIMITFISAKIIDDCYITVEKCDSEKENYTSDEGKKKAKAVVTCNAAGVILLLGYFKYLTNSLPIGISFYSFTALGYVIDVYRRKVKSERNIVIYTSFIAFFPPLVSGPIERADNLLKKMKEKRKWDEDLFRHGFYQMLWGYFQKVVIADRIAVLVSSIYDHHENYPGIYILIATFLYAFQIYCDFAGYSNLAIGAAKMMGFSLRENFNVPYLSSNIKEFWSRWHISLSSWLRDYVYISLGGNRKGKMRKWINLMITFLVSGVWHGENITFVIWGALHGIYNVIYDMFDKNNQRDHKKTNVIRKSLGVIVTFVSVDFAWLFFRANSVSDAFDMIRKIIFELQPLELLNRELAISMGMEIADIGVLAAALCILVIVDAFHKKMRIKERVDHLPLVFRWVSLYVFMFVILIFGYYGPGFEAGQFIYAQF